MGIFPLDYLAWTQATAKVVSIPLEKLPAGEIKSRKLLLQGQFSPRASKELRKLGWVIDENVDFRPKS